MSDGFPEFSIGRDFYDNGTFSGRFRHFSNVVSPISLLKSENEIQKAADLLKESKLNFNSGIVDGYSNKGNFIEKGKK